MVTGDRNKLGHRLDRRSDPRVRNPDVIARLVTSMGAIIRCAARDLSAGGARLVTPGVLKLAPGERLAVLLRRPRPGSTLRLPAVIVRAERIDDRWTSVAVRFEPLAAPSRDALDAIVGRRRRDRDRE